MTAGTAWLVVGLAAAVTAAIKGAGPFALGGRPLPRWFAGVIALMAPALLSALVLVASVTEGQRLALGAETIGVAAAGLLYWRGGSVITGVVLAAALTAGLRALGVG